MDNELGEGSLFLEQDAHTESPFVNSCGWVGGLSEVVSTTRRGVNEYS